MKIAILATLVAGLTASAAAHAQTYVDGTGKPTTVPPLSPLVIAPVGAAFYNAGGVLTQVSPTNPLPTTGSGGGSSGSVTQGTSPWVDNLAQLGGVNVSLGSGASDAGTLRVVLGGTEPSLPVTGAFYQATQPVSGSVSVSNLPSIQPVSAASLPLPTGAATSANQTTQVTAEQASAAALAATLKTQQQTGGTLTDPAAVLVGTTSTQVVPAGSGAFRYRASIWNLSTTAGNYMYCRADGGTAAPGTGVVIQPNAGAYEWTYPMVGVAAINCTMATGAANASVEYVQ